MARHGRQPKVQPQSSSTQSQAIGKPKASQRKAAATAFTPAAPLDVYSFSSAVKRPRGDIDPESRARSISNKRKGKTRQEDDSELEDSDGESAKFGADNVVEFTGVKPKGLYMGGESDDGEDEDARINSEDDEDIDSDEAFEDEEDLPANPQKGKPSRRNDDINLDEDDPDPDDEEGGAYMDLSELLDTGEYASEDSDEGTSGSGDEEDDSESADDSMSEMDDDEPDSEFEGALDKLGSFVDGLESKKRKAGVNENEGDRRKKRVVLKERTEAYAEGEFVAVTAPDRTQDNLNLDDLLASFAGSKNPRLAALRKTLKPLAALSDTTTATASKSHLKTPGPLSAPLPLRLQDKIDREAAYEQTKEETDKWNETVRRMKGESGLGVEGARHERITLPLLGGAGDVARGASSAEWSAKFQPTNELETSIQSLLAAGQMQTSDLQKAERAALAALDPADVAARQAELRQQRDLMFRAERKAKRVSKIKSKAFRRIHRRAKGKGENGLSLDDMAELDEIDGGDRVTEERARMEIARARERATLKHSAKGGRWAKRVGGIDGLDEERNAAVRQMVERGEQLRKKIAGIDVDDSDDGYGDDGSEEDDEDADYESIRRTAFDELASLDAKDAAAIAAAPKLKGVLNMKFMKDAVARGERKVQGDADELRRRLANLAEGQEQGASDGEASDNVLTGISEQIDGNLGRMVFGPSAGSAASTSITSVSTPKQVTASTTKLSGPLAIASSAPSRSYSTTSLLSSVTAGSAKDSNPWLQLGDGPSSSKVSRKMNKAAVGKDSRDISRMAAKVDRHKSKLEDARAAEKDDAQIELDLHVVLAPSKAADTLRNTARQLKPSAGVSSDVVEDGVISSDEDEEEEHNAQRGKGAAAFRQRDLVAKAFADDNVIADFQAEKRREIERDAPREEDNTLPGWGTWSGKGVKKHRNAKKFITHIPGIAPAARQDAAFSNVIISEKKDKKAAKYLLKDLPFPYTSAAQHEHKLRTPLGHEWSTSTIVRDQTLPRVQVKPGVTIRPVDRKI